MSWGSACSRRRDNSLGKRKASIGTIESWNDNGYWIEKASYARVGVARENGYGKKKNSMGTNGSRNIMDIEKEASFARVGMEREDGYLKEKVSIGTIESRRENNDSWYK